MSWIFGDIRNFFLKLTATLGLYLVVLTTPRNSAEKITLTVVDGQKMPDIEKIDPKEEFSCLRWTMYNGRRKV